MADTKRVNSSPLSAREGKVYIDGVLVADSCKFKVVFKPDVWSGKQLSEHGTNRRWIGYDIEVQITQWKTTRMYRTMIDKYLKSGITPEMTIQGVQTDTNSDFYVKNKSEKVTCIGCVPTGDINLIDMDTDGDVVKEDITFGAKKVA
ncbi:phage tail tube protein [Blautia sp. Sow4_E7]|uniref:phage tail tube protein n=1 Tax=Blautia sp. Sow4_E7 TaxID=3438749 RepID=UPI003F909139